MFGRAERRQQPALFGILLPEPAVQEWRLRSVLVGERPLQAAAFFEQTVGHSMVFRRYRAQVVPDLLSGLHGPVMTQTLRDQTHDLDVILRTSRWFQSFSHTLDSPLAVGERAIALAPRRR